MPGVGVEVGRYRGHCPRLFVVEHDAAGRGKGEWNVLVFWCLGVVMSWGVGTLGWYHGESGGLPN